MFSYSIVDLALSPSDDCHIGLRVDDDDELIGFGTAEGCRIVYTGFDIGVEGAVELLLSALDLAADRS